MEYTKIEEFQEFALSVADDVAGRFADADPHRILCWAYAMTNAALIWRMSRDETKTAQSCAEESVSIDFSSRFASDLIGILENDMAIQFDHVQRESSFPYYGEFLESALVVVESPLLEEDPDDLARFISAAERTTALQETESIDDRIAFSIVADIVMAKLKWERRGPSSSYGLVGA